MTLDLSSVGAKAEHTSRYDWRDTALYALALGAGTDDLAFLRNQPAPAVLPTYGVIPAFEPVFDVITQTGANLVQLLHTAQRTEQVSPFPAQGHLLTTATLRGLWDMKVGAMALVDTETSVDGQLCARTTWELLLRGEGGFGGERPPSLPRTRVPKDSSILFEETVETLPQQALLYRLTGDINPIHSDPDVAKAAGFDRPILHGLCTYGIAARAALKNLANNDPQRFLSFEARFAKVVMPGDTLVVRGHALPESSDVAVTVTVAENATEAIASARFCLRGA